jgi:predicted SAM-dependent methyltransferase
VIKKGWLNIDLFSNESDLKLDLREPWPFRDCTAAIVYSEHVFEHFEYPFETGKLLSEAWRVLAPGGKFSLGVPDCEYAAQSYVARDEEFHRRERENGLPPEVTTPMDHLNYTFRQRREHKYSYDLETLTKVLTTANFVSVCKRPFDPTLDSPHREWGTLYMDATKP